MKRFIFSFLFLLILADSSFAGVTVLGGLTREMTLSPGDKFEGTIQLLNKGEDAAHVKVLQTDYVFFSDGQTFYNEPGSTPRSNAGWLSISPSRITIPPKETASFYYEVKVPELLDLKGTYWSVVMIEPVADSATRKVEEQDGKVVLGLQTVIRYAVQIITNIGETGNSNIRLIGNKLINYEGKTIFQSDIENTGDRWLSPFVWAELYNKDGIYIGRFESDRKRIFPTCSVRHHLDLTDVPKGQYTALLVIDNGDDRVFGANYQVRLE
jgi:hypothetical protein